MNINRLIKLILFAGVGYGLIYLGAWYLGSHPLSKNVVAFIFVIPLLSSILYFPFLIYRYKTGWGIIFHPGPAVSFVKFVQPKKASLRHRQTFKELLFIFPIALIVFYGIVIYLGKLW